MRASLALSALLVLAQAGCGYRFAHAPSDPLGPFAIVSGAVLVPHAAAIASAEEGARAELSRAGQLAGAGVAGTIEIEILRVDETGEGIALPAGAAAPLARGVRVTVVGRARMRRAGSTAVERDTGDVRAGEVATRADGAARGVVVGDEASRRAARRLGEILVRKLLGFPEPGEP